jgi:hypothetical protein
MSIDKHAANDSAVGSESKPFIPFLIIDLTKGQSLHPTTGKPIENASVNARLKPSNAEGNAKIEELASF